MSEADSVAPAFTSLMSPWVRLARSLSGHTDRRHPSTTVALALSIAFSTAIPGRALATTPSVEFFGSGFAPTSSAAIFPITVYGSGSEFLVGTYSYSGGTTPGGNTVASGGIDSILDLTQGATSLLTNDDLVAPVRDSEMRSIGYPPVAIRSGAATRSTPLPAGTYEVRLRRFGSTSGSNWSLAIASNAYSLTVNAPTLVAGQTIDTINVYGNNGDGTDGLRLTSGTTAVTNAVNVDDGPLGVIGAALSVPNATFIDRSSFSANQGSCTFTTLKLAANDYADTRATWIDSTINVAGAIRLGDGVNARASVFQNAGTVTAASLALGSASSGSGSAYDLLSGTLSVGNITLGTGSSPASNTLTVRGGTLQLPDFGNLHLTAGVNLFWSSGTIAVTGSGGDIRSIWGAGGVSLTANQRLDVGSARAFSAPITINGGTLVGDNLDAYSAVQWVSGTLDLSGINTNVLATSSYLGSNLAITQGKTLLVNNLNVPAGTALSVSTGGLIHSTGATSNSGITTLTGPAAQIAADLGFTNYNLLGGSGLIRGNFTNGGSAARVTLNDGDALLFDGTLTNTSGATIRLAGGSATVTSGITNATGASIAGRGSLTATTLANAGTVTFSGGTSDLDASLSNNAGGKVIVTGDANLTVYRPVTNAASSEFRVSPGSSVAFLSNVTGLGAFTGTGTKFFEAAASGAALMDVGGSSVVEMPATLTTAGIRETSLTVRGNAKIVASSPTSLLNTLDLDGGKLDLTNNSLVIDYTGPSPAATVRAAIIGGSIYSSTTPSANRAIGYAESSALGATTFGGLTVDSTSLLIRWTLTGDADLSGSVAFTDLLALARNYGGTGKVWSQGDFNYDGNVNFSDLLALARSYGGTLPASDAAALEATAASPNFSGDWALAQALAPEPAASMLLIGLLAGRRRSPRQADASRPK